MDPCSCNHPRGEMSRPLLNQEWSPVAASSGSRVPLTSAGARQALNPKGSPMVANVLMLVTTKECRPGEGAGACRTPSARHER